MTEQRYVPLEGSEKTPRMDATIQGRAESSERLQVTLVPKEHITSTDAAIRSFARQYGLRLTPEHGLVKLAGSVADFEAAFHVQLFEAVTEGDERFRSRVPPGEEPSVIHVPEELAPYVTAVLGLDNRPAAKPHFQVYEPGIEAREGEPAPRYTAQQVGQMYHFPPGDGAGRSVAVIELGGGFGAADLQAAGVDASTVIAVGVDGAGNAYSGNPNSADGEVALDIQVIAGVAPRCRQYVYFAPNTDAGFLDACAAAIHQTLRPDALSISWGMYENGWTAQARAAFDAVFAQGVSLGIPSFCASGDGGSKDGSNTDQPDFPASAPHATGCGGTTLASNGEVVWSGSGGGVSKAFPKPGYQSALSIAGRGVPDIAGDADPQTGYTVVVGGRMYNFGGTSAVAPLWAGLTALLVAALGRPIGDLNSQLYRMAPGTLRDITQGSNGGFSAQPGWDACTGLGSPDGSKLLAALGGVPQQPPAPQPPAPTPTPAYPVKISTVDTISMSDGTTVTRTLTWP